MMKILLQDGLKKRISVMAVLLMAATSSAELREWTLRSGATVRAEFVTLSFDRIVLRDEDGKRITFDFEDISEADATYVELVNPPDLVVDLLKSSEQVFVKPSPIWVDNSPVNILRYTFGARVKQRCTTEYNHDLWVEIYAVARQVYDPDKYQLVCKWKSLPFRLSVENGRRCEIRAPQVVELEEFRLAGEYPRGREFAETVIVVRDERGVMVAHRTTKNWLFDHLDKLDALPEGAWFDKSCQRVHPTSPRAVWFN